MPVTSRPSARDRLLAAADELFYAEGIQSVGIDRVIERAGVAKASLYRSFDGKDDLIAAYLDVRHRQNVSQLRQATGSLTDPREQLLEIFRLQGRWISADSYLGCPFTRASAEAPADSRVKAAVGSYRAEVRSLLRECADAGGATDPETLVLQLETLFHGSAVLVTFEPRRRLAHSVQAAAAALIDAGLPPSP